MAVQRQSVLLVLLFSALSVLVSCTREAVPEDSALKFAIRTSSIANSQSVSSMTAESLSSMNCFFVMAGSPNGLNQNQCETSNNTIIPVGIVSPIIPKNSSGVTELAIDVPSGTNRNITLLGFTISSGSCPLTMNDYNPSGGVHSEPYILGHVAGISLASGVQQVNMNIAFDSSKKIEDCEGPSFPSGSGGGGSSDNPYLRLEGINNYLFGENPDAKPMTIGMCHKAKLAVYKCTNTTTCDSAPYTLTSTVAVEVNSTSSFAFYLNESQCRANSDAFTGNIGISIGTNYTDVWVAVPLGAPVTSSFKLDSSVIAGINGENPENIEYHMDDFTHIKTGKVKMLANNVPSTVYEISSNCINNPMLNFTLRDASNSFNLPNYYQSTSQVFPQVTTYSLNLSNNASFQSDANCTSSIGTILLFNIQYNQISFNAKILTTVSSGAVSFNPSNNYEYIGPRTAVIVP